MADKAALFKEAERRGLFDDKDPALVAEMKKRLGVEDISKTESGLRGAAQGATLGFGDELSALAELVIGKVLSPDVYEGQTYQKLRDENRSTDAAAREANPWTYGLSEVAGGALPAVAGGYVAGKMASPVLKTIFTPKTLGQAIKSGATFGGVSGAGQTESFSDPVRAAMDIGGGAAIGAGTGALMHGLFGPKAGKVAKEAELPKPTALEPTAAEVLPPEKPFLWSEVEVKPKDKAVATMAGKQPERVAYWNENKAQIEKNIKNHSLDTNADNSLAKEIPGDLDAFDSHLKKLKDQGDDLLVKSKASLSNEEIAAAFEETADALTASGRNISDSDLATIGQLKKYADRIVPKIEEEVADAAGKPTKVMVPKVEEWDATRIKNTLRGLWNDYENAYKPGHVSTFDESVLKHVLGNINARLKQIAGPRYAKVMDRLSADIEAKNLLTKLWKPNTDNIPQAPTWFKQNFVYQMQDSQFGNRPATTNIVEAIGRLGQVAKKNYSTIVRDNLVYGDLFPEAAKGLQLGTDTKAWSKAARKFLGPLEGTADAAVIVKNYLMNKALRGEGTVGPAVASGVGAVAEGGKAAMQAGGKVLPFAKKAFSAIAAPPISAPAAARFFSESSGEPGTSPDLSREQPTRDDETVSTPRTEERTLSPSDSSGEANSRQRRQEELQTGQSSQPSQASGTPYAPSGPLGKYSHVLSAARARGPQAEAVTDYLLQQQDPEYRALRVKQE